MGGGGGVRGMFDWSMEGEQILKQKTKPKSNTVGMLHYKQVLRIPVVCGEEVKFKH